MRKSYHGNAKWRTLLCGRSFDELGRPLGDSALFWETWLSEYLSKSSLLGKDNDATREEYMYPKRTPSLVLVIGGEVSRKYFCKLALLWPSSSPDLSSFV